MADVDDAAAVIEGDGRPEVDVAVAHADGEPVLGGGVADDEDVVAGVAAVADPDAAPGVESDAAGAAELARSCALASERELELPVLREHPRLVRVAVQHQEPAAGERRQPGNPGERAGAGPVQLADLKLDDARAVRHGGRRMGGCAAGEQRRTGKRGERRR